MSAHPRSVFVQPIKPGRSCFGFIELSSVIYPGCLNPTFVQRAPDLLQIVNMSLLSGVFPQAMKTAVI